MSGPELVVFSLLGLAGVGSAVAVVSGKDLFRSTLFFGSFLLSVAGLYFTLEASFVGIMQIFVYVGGVVVMILFGIMLTQQEGARLNASLERRLTVAGPVALLAGILIAAIMTTSFKTVREVPGVDIATLGKLFTNDYVLPFEIVSVLLLAALVGAVVVAKEREK
ncbi:MAG: NADH-quinone oxidoreductase subunit J [Actinobacteria bacterium]|nr:NADH-quinone oxidoreductase subunit J [Actinomycetota bacterium]